MTLIYFKIIYHADTKTAPDRPKLFSNDTLLFCFHMTTLKAQFIKNLPNLPKTVQVACATFN